MRERARGEILVIVIIVLLVIFAFSNKDGDEDLSPLLSGIIVTTGSEGGWYEKKPADEYVILEIDLVDKDFYHLGSLAIYNKTGESVLLGGAVNNFKQGTVNTERPVVLNENSRIIISSGPSPLGVSFRENKCSGFLEENQNFYPPLELDCPSASKIIQSLGLEASARCLSHLKDMPICTSVGSQILNYCPSGIVNALNYNSCVLTESGGLDFNSNVWRFYLNRDSEFWSNDSEKITVEEGSRKTLLSKRVYNF